MCGHVYTPLHPCILVYTHVYLYILCAAMCIPPLHPCILIYTHVYMYILCAAMCIPPYVHVHSFILMYTYTFYVRPCVYPPTSMHTHVYSCIPIHPMCGHVYTLPPSLRGGRPPSSLPPGTRRGIHMAAAAHGIYRYT